MSEGTALNNGAGGDGVSTEDITGQPRLGGIVPSVPVAPSGASDMKIERTKLSIGPFGYDWGDVGGDNPLPTHDYWSRELLERVVRLLGGAEADRTFARGGEHAARVLTPSVTELLADLIDLLKRRQLNAAPRAGGEVRFNSLTASLTAATALMANPLRQGATFYNDRTVAGAGNAYLLLWDGSTTITTAKASIPLVPGAYFEVPYGFVGRIDVVWDVATGTLQVTELM
jgi:hypothetical protein